MKPGIFIDGLLTLRKIKKTKLIISNKQKSVMFSIRKIKANKAVRTSLLILKY